MTDPRSWPCCLIVEDDSLVALSVEDWLEEAGYDVCGPLGSTREALAWLALNSPRAAIVDVGLKHGPSTDVVRELRRRNGPVVVYSGLPRDSADPEFDSLPWVLKSQGRAALLDALTNLLPQDITSAN